MTELNSIWVTEKMLAHVNGISWDTWNGSEADSVFKCSWHVPSLASWTAFLGITSCPDSLFSMRGRDKHKAPASMKFTVLISQQKTFSPTSPPWPILMGHLGSHAHPYTNPKTRGWPVLIELVWVAAPLMGRQAVSLIPNPLSDFPKNQGVYTC